MFLLTAEHIIASNFLYVGHPKEPSEHLMRKFLTPADLRFIFARSARGDILSTEKTLRQNFDKIAV